MSASGKRERYEDSPQTGLAREVGVKQPAVAQFESGQTRPAESTLTKIAFATGFPETFFTREPYGDIPLGTLAFRARRSKTSGLDIDQAHAWTEILTECAAGLARHLETVPVVLPRIEGEDASAAARLVRSELGLAPGRPVVNMTYVLEQAGVAVFALPVKLPDRDAFSAWARNARGPITVVSSGQSGERLRFSLAHELKHLVVDVGLRGYVKEAESSADEFAAEFLMPEEAIRDELRGALDVPTLLHLKRRWGTSVWSLTRRASDLGLISPRRAQKLYRSFAARWGRQWEPEGLPVEKPRVFRKMIEALYGEPPSIPRFALDYDLLPAMANALVAAHAERAEVVATVEGNRSSKIVPFRTG